MRTFVILAAGRGSRMNRDWQHKSLVPISHRAPLSHIMALAPQDAKIVVCLGYLGPQVRKYVELAHPTRSNIEFVEVPGWNAPGAGPGASLAAARSAVEGDLYLTSADTLWERDMGLWREERSWAAVAPVPSGTPLARWCRMKVEDDLVVRIIDKEPGDGLDSYAYTGLAHVRAADLDAFWQGLHAGELREGEMQVTGGLAAVPLWAQHIRWIDVGDEAAYHAAVRRLDGYDFSKPREATYVLPEEGRVVKVWEDASIRERRYRRGRELRGAVPKLVEDDDEHFLAYEYVPGVSGYAREDIIDDVLYWGESQLWHPLTPPRECVQSAAYRFYAEKTHQRIEQLPPDLRARAQDAVSRVNWQELVEGTRPTVIHGDCNLGNLVVANGGTIVGIDWREDFGGEVGWGDQRYDLGKLLAGCIVNWDRARTGDFRPWLEGLSYANAVRGYTQNDRGVEIIGALSLLNSAPLHAPPLDEVLVARGTAWLEESV